MEETLSTLQFTAMQDTEATFFTAGLDGSISFTDAAVLDNVIGLDNTTVVSQPENIVRAGIRIAGGSISGTKFDDVDGDGMPADDTIDEPDVPNVEIELFENNVRIDSTLTDADGNYAFTDLPEGDYIVREVVPTGSIQTTPSDGIFQIDVNPPAPVTGLLFGNFTLTTLGGLKSEDLNDNGVFDAGEGIANVTMQLDLNRDGTIDATTLTDTEGRYAFTGVGPGTHRITEIVPGGYVSPPTPAEHLVANRSGSNRDNLNFLNRKITPVDASLQGFVYTDNDGIFDPVETGLPNVIITLTSIDNSVVPAITQTTRTGPDGGYRFADLPAGTYRIVPTQSDGFGDASITLGRILPGGVTSGSTDGLNAFANIQLGENETAIDYNFGDVLTNVTERLFNASTDVRGELAANAAAPAVTIQGTSGDDHIVVQNLGDAGFQIFVNETPGLIIAPEQSAHVIIDGRVGRDRVEYRGNEQSEQITSRPGRLALTTPTQSLGVFDVDDIRVQGGGGDDSATILDSTGADTLTASGPAVLVMLAENQSIGMLDIPGVQAISDTDTASDTATTETLDFVLQLAGDWTTL